MSIMVDNLPPKPEGWIEQEITENMIKAIGKELYQALGRRAIKPLTNKCNSDTVGVSDK